VGAQSLVENKRDLSSNQRYRRNLYITDGENELENFTL